MRRWMIGLIAALAVGGAGGALHFVRDRLIPPAGAVPGLRIEGAVLSRGADPRAQIEVRGRRLAGQHIRLRLAPDTPPIETTLGELGVSVDVDTTLRRALDIGRSGPLAVRLDQILRARAGRIDVPLALAFDPERAVSLLLSSKERLDRSPRAARLETRTGSTLPHQMGRLIELDTALATIRQAASELASALGAARDSYDLEIAPLDVEPTVTSSLVERLDHHTLVAEYKSYFGSGGGRGKNIELGASRLDGIVLPPGEIVSFNEVVGARSKANGFQAAPEIYKGEMVRGIGGGTCQVASTFYAAAFLAGFDVVERYPHSRPSGYVPLGLDSTVSWPGVDLKIRNPWPFPILVQARVNGGLLEVALYGRERPASVSWHSETLEILPFERKVTEADFAPDGGFIRKQKGISGYRILRTRQILMNDGTRRVEHSVDTYPPTPEHFVVRPGADPDSVLPPPAEAQPEQGESDPSGNSQTVGAG